MPIGVICNVLAVALGGVLGAALKRHIGEAFKDKLNMIFGLCSMAMGIASIVLMENMPAVVFSLILGTAVGIWLRLGERFESGAARVQGLFARLSGGATGSDAQTAAFITVIVLFCASGTGIYGAIVSGMSGDHSILVSKSILDLFTSMIFACSLGAVVSVIAIPQLCIFLALFFLARFIYPLTTPAMINDFKACGGFIMLATGFRIIKVKMFPTADMIPAMILVMPLSWLWAAWILPLLA
ncbi:MAG: DUF554 domain-containing protein [Clostridia bacterium]|nr:DUF554 domain-containing protein [Clostridia bacterium]